MRINDICVIIIIYSKLAKFEGKMLSAPIENLRKDIRMRAESDPMMSTAWLLVYLIPIFAAIVGILTFFFMIFMAAAHVPTGPPYPLGPPFVPMFVGWMVLFPLLGIIGFIVSIILRYKLVKRRNTHFKRQLFLLEDSIGAVRSIATKKGVDVEPGLSSCERTLREAKSEETEKGSVLWAILSAIIFLAEWYVSYFLMKDFYKHERREDGLWEDLGKVLDKCGITFSLPRRTEVIPNRSFVLYLILTIITLGFKYHIQVEDELLSALESVAI